MSKATPKDLKGDAAEFYRRIASSYDLTDAGLSLLQVAAFTLQRWIEARRHIDKHGLLQQSKTMVRLSPLAKVEHDCRLSFCRLLKEMNLDHEYEGALDELENKIY